MKNLTKKIFLTVFTAIIVIVFGAWGMGDIFSSGKKNIIAEVGKDKIFIQDYINEARIYLEKNNKDSLNDNDHFIILNTVITQKIYEAYAKDQGLIINDNALAFYLKSNEKFKDDKGKFSRIKYEKYLLEKNLNAVTLEFFLKKELVRNLSFKTYLTGISAPKYHTDKLRNDFLKTIDASFFEINENRNVTENEIINFFEKNKSQFKLGEVRNGFVTNLSPESFGFKEENDDYYKLINDLENFIINGSSHEQLVKQFNLKPSIIEDLNAYGLNIDSIESKQKIYAKNLFSLNTNIKTDIFEIEGKKYLINLKDIKKNVIPTLNQNLKNKIKKNILKQNNTKIVNNLVNNIKKDKNEFLNYAIQKKINIQKMNFKNINDSKNIFNNKNMEKIFTSKLNDTLVLNEIDKIYLLKIDKFGKNNNKIENIDKILKSQVEQEFEASIIKDFDAYLLNTYPVKINQKTLKEVKKSI